jgi:ADP-heptose:LPS heptosyltransferase
LVAPLTGDAVPSRDAGELRSLVIDAQPPRDERIALQLSDKWARLNVPDEQVEALVLALQTVAPLRVIAARDEEAYARRFGVPVDYFDDTDGWKAAVAAARVVVAPDSGAVHLAGTIGTPVVAVFPPQRAFDAQTARWSPWASPHRIVRADDGWPSRAAGAAIELLA